MSDLPPTHPPIRPPTHQEPTPSRPAQVAVGAAQVGEFFLRDQLVSATVFFSVISLLATLAAPTALHVVLLVLVGLAGAVVPWVALARRWPAGRTWLTLGGLLVVNVVVLVSSIAAG